MLQSILVGLIAKVGLDKIRDLGYFPQSSYLSRALRCLKQDDLDGAISSYLLAIRRKEPTDKSEIVREIITQAVDIRMQKLQEMHDEILTELYPKQWTLRLWYGIKRRFNEEFRLARAGRAEELKEYQEGLRVLEQLKIRLDTGAEQSTA
ncbi:MAG: hypothetical protein ACE3NC_01670 [Candidatus Wallacebacter cryptica]|jgi:hypothetical protein|nr:hypothetical protein [Bacillota bacterium]